MTRSACLLLLSATAFGADPPAPKPPADVLLPADAVRRFGEFRLRHPGGVRQSALSPDGKLLATAGTRSVVLWDAATGAAVRRLDLGPGDHFRARGLAFSPDGSRLASADGTEVVVWDARTGEEVRRLADAPAGNGFAALVGFTPDGRLVVGRESDTEFRDPATGKVVRSVPVPGVLLSPAGPTLVSQPPAGGKVSLADLSGAGPAVRKVELKVETHPGGLALSPDGRTLATFSVFGVLTLWSVPDGRELKSVDVKGDARAPYLAFAPDGRTIVQATIAGLVGWDAVTLTPTGIQAFPADAIPARAAGIQFLPDGDTMLVCDRDGAVRRLSLRTGKPLGEPVGYSAGAQAAATPDGRRLVVGDRSGRVDVWDAVTGRRVATPSGPGDPVSRVAVSADGRTVAVGRSTGAIELRDAATGKETDRYEPGRPGANSFFRLLALAPDGGVLFATGSLRTWQPGAESAGWVGQAARLGAYSADGQYLVTAIDGPGLRVFDLAGREWRRVSFERPPREPLGTVVTALAVSPDGRWLAVASDDGRLRLCDGTTAVDRATFLAVPPPVDPGRRFPASHGLAALAFSEDGLWLLGGGPDTAVRLWEVNTQHEVRRFDGHDGPVTFVAFGPGGRTVLSAGQDGAVYQWDLRAPRGRPVRSAWDDLADDKSAYPAMRAILDDPAAAVALLRDRLRPAVAPKPEELNRLIRDLNSDAFPTREAATRGLTDLGPLAVPALKRAAAGTLPAEARERVTRLLNRPPSDRTPGELRSLRAVQVLERIGTPEAGALLAEWAAGAEGALLTVEAKEAAWRLVRARRDR